jgi:hypothetical protein
MRIAIAAAVFFLISGNCFAQSSGGGGSSGGSAGGGSAGSGAGAAAPGGGSAGSLAPAPSTAISPTPRAPGVANTPVDPQRNNVDAQPPTRRLPGSPAAGASGQPDPSSNPSTSNPPPSGGRADPGGANSSPASRRNAAQAAVAECEGLWDKETHMTRDQWRATCRRIQNRLNDVTAPTGERSGSRALR